LGKSLYYYFINTDLQYDYVFVRPNGALLNRVVQLVEDGKVKAVVDKVYSINDIREAHSAIEKGHSRGKLVIRITE
jgi:NADPH:quinone reductase-like Zn-dependent oxidoreductase